MTAPDLRTQFPRRGREMLGGYAFLARVIIGYCPLSKAFLDAAGVSHSQFDALITKGASDEAIVEHFNENVSEERRKRANEVILRENASHLDEQDAEEGVRA